MVSDESNPAVPVLDEHELATVVGLLARVMRIDEANKRARELVEECQTAIEERKPTRNKFVEAIGAFGFDMKGAGVWDRLKEAIGEETYASARKIANVNPIKLSVDAGKVPERSGKPIDLTTSNQVVLNSSGEREQAPKISDAILEFLRVKGKNGALVQEVKNYLAETYGMTPHEKTPGMTLYRLSLSNLVRRSGRRWFVTETKSFEPEPSGGSFTNSKSG